MGTESENKASVQGSGFGRELPEQPETVKVQLAPAPLPKAPEPEQPPAEPEPDAQPVPEPVGSAHQSIPDGPSGARGWCEGCQQYCGGTNPEGDPITCISHPY